MFSWQYFWSFYDKAHPRAKQHVIKELLDDDWLFDLPSEVQIDVLRDAPKEFVNSIEFRLKPDTVKSLKPSLIDWSKI